MQVQNVHLILGDELQPQVGCGHRIVKAQVGRKWVYVRETEHTNRKRIKRGLWDDLCRQSEAYFVRNNSHFTS